MGLVEYRRVFLAYAGEVVDVEEPAMAAGLRIVRMDMDDRGTLMRRGDAPKSFILASSKAIPVSAYIIGFSLARSGSSLEDGS